MFEPLRSTSCGPQLSTVSAFQCSSWMRGACPGFGWVTVTGVLKLLPRTLLALPLSFGVHGDFLTFRVSQVKWNIRKKKSWFYFTWHFYMLCREAVSDHFVSILSETEVKTYLGCWKNKGLHSMTRLAWREIVTRKSRLYLNVLRVCLPTRRCASESHLWGGLSSLNELGKCVCS